MRFERHKHPINQEPGRQLGPDEAEWMSDLVDTYDLWATSNGTGFYELYQQSLAMEILGPTVESRLKLVSPQTETRNAEIAEFSLTDEEYHKLLGHFHSRVKAEALYRVSPSGGDSNPLNFALASNLLAQHMYFSHPIIRRAMETPSQIKDHSTLLLTPDQTKQIKQKLNHPTRLAHLVLMQSFTRRLVSSLADDDATTRTQAKEIVKNIPFASPKIRQKDISSLELVTRTIASSLLVGDLNCSWFDQMKATWNQELVKAVSQGEKESDSRFYLHLPDKVLANLNKMSKIIVDARILESNLDSDQPMYPDAIVHLPWYINQLKEVVQQKQRPTLDKFATSTRDDIEFALGHKAAGVIEFTDTGATVGMSVEFSTNDGKARIVDYTIWLDEGRVSVYVNATNTNMLSESTMQSLIKTAVDLVQAETARLSKLGIQFARPKDSSGTPTTKPSIPTRWTNQANGEPKDASKATAQTEPTETKPKYILRKNLFEGIDPSVRSQLEAPLLWKLNNFTGRRYGRTTKNQSVRGEDGQKIHIINLPLGYRALYVVIDGVKDVYKLLPHDSYIQTLNNKKSN